ncbi:MAG: hydrogenase iron-sulfur subunit [candidate division KSB1 bacterium]|nr:hydrogenase iron-sulfur subunit [candidate division KSB1 bacterium]
MWYIDRTPEFIRLFYSSKSADVVDSSRFQFALEKLGIRPERLQLEWVSAAEGQKWATVMKAVEEMRQKVTKEEVEYTMKVLREDEKPKVAKLVKEKVEKVAVAASV